MVTQRGWPAQTYTRALSSTACISLIRRLSSWRARLQEPPPIEKSLAADLYLKRGPSGIGRKRQEDKPELRGAYQNPGLPAVLMPPLPPPLLPLLARPKVGEHTDNDVSCLSPVISHTGVH